MWAVSIANLNVASPRRASRNNGAATGQGVISVGNPGEAVRIQQGDGSPINGEDSSSRNTPSNRMVVSTVIPAISATSSRLRVRPTRT